MAEAETGRRRFAGRAAPDVAVDEAPAEWIADVAETLSTDSGSERVPVLCSEDPTSMTCWNNIRTS